MELTNIRSQETKPLSSAGNTRVCNMPFDSSSWVIKVEETEATTCECCGDPGRVIKASICETDGQEIAYYTAFLNETKASSCGMLLHLLAEPFEKIVALSAELKEGRLDSFLVTSRCLPSDVGMTREEALVTPGIDLIFDLARFITGADPFIRPFFAKRDEVRRN